MTARRRPGLGTNQELARRHNLGTVLRHVHGAGQISRAELAHYRRVIEYAISQGVQPVVTLHHFTSPAWFRSRGGWTGPETISGPPTRPGGW